MYNTIYSIYYIVYIKAYIQDHWRRTHLQCQNESHCFYIKTDPLWDIDCTIEPVRSQSVKVFCRLFKAESLFLQNFSFTSTHVASNSFFCHLAMKRLDKGEFVVCASRAAVLPTDSFWSYLCVSAKSSNSSKFFWATLLLQQLRSFVLIHDSGPIVIGQRIARNHNLIIIISLRERFHSNHFGCRFLIEKVAKTCQINNRSDKKLIARLVVVGNVSNCAAHVRKCPWNYFPPKLAPPYQAVIHTFYLPRTFHVKTLFSS